MILLTAAYYVWAVLPLVPEALGPNRDVFFPGQEMTQIMIGVAAIMVLCLLLGATLSFWKGARWSLLFLLIGGIGSLLIAVATIDKTKAYLGWMMTAVNFAAFALVAMQRPFSGEGVEASELSGR